MDNYYLSNNIPEVFKIADRMMEEKYPQPKKVKKPRKVPMPDIKSNPNVEGPLYVTEEWYNKKVAKREKKIKKMQREYEIEMIQLIARRDMLKKKLGELNPGKKKDSKKIAAINIELINIREDLDEITAMSGLNITDIDNGTRLGRFLGRLKIKAKKIWKKTKKFYRRNSELIQGICAIVLPVIGSLIYKAITKS